MQIPLKNSGVNTDSGTLAIGTTEINVTPLPTTQTGYMVLDSDVAASAEEVSYSHSGSNPVTISATTKQHTGGFNWLIDNTNGYYQEKADSPTWSDWTPTYGGSSSMTFGTITTHYARYAQVGKIVFFEISATGTTGGTASTDITFTLPVAPKNASSTVFLSFSVFIRDTATASGYGYIDDTKAYVRRYDSSNWGLGSSRSIRASGHYEIA